MDQTNQMNKEVIRAKERITERELAFLWNMHPGTLRRQRSQKKGPRYLKIGRKVEYPMVEVIEYEVKNTVLIETSN